MSIRDDSPSARITDAVRIFGETAKRAGVSARELGAALRTLGRVGVDFDKSLTEMASVLARVEPPQQWVLEEHGGISPMSELLRGRSSHTSGMHDALYGIDMARERDRTDYPIGEYQAFLQPVDEVQAIAPPKEMEFGGFKIVVDSSVPEKPPVRMIRFRGRNDA